MKADLPYKEKQAELQKMADSLDRRASNGDPIALLSDAPRTVEVYYRFMVQNSVYFNLVAAATEICLVNANTGQLPQRLPDGLPKDPFTGKDFEYERTEKGFVLRFDPEDVGRIRVRQFEFRTAPAGQDRP